MTVKNSLKPLLHKAVLAPIKGQYAPTPALNMLKAVDMVEVVCHGDIVTKCIVTAMEVFL